MNEDPAARMAMMLAALWQRNQPHVRERVRLLEQAAAELGKGTLSAADCEQAIAAAHKLAGTLGMFGYPQGTEIARLLEEQLDLDVPDAALVAKLTKQLSSVLFPPVQTAD